MDGLIDLTSPTSEKGGPSPKRGLDFESNLAPTKAPTNNTFDEEEDFSNVDEDNDYEYDYEYDYDDYGVDNDSSDDNDDNDEVNDEHSNNNNSNNSNNSTNNNKNNTSLNSSIFSDDDDILTKPSYLTSANINSKADLKAKKKTEKRARQEHEKQQKQNKKLQLAQEAGRFAEKEITCLIEEDLVKSDCGNKIVESLKGQEVPFNVCIQANDINGSIRWFQRSYTLGGATHLEEHGNVEAPVMSVVFWKPEKFLHLLRKDNLSDSDLPHLREWVKKVRREKKMNEMLQSQRIVVVLLDAVGEVNRKWQGRQNARRQSGGAPTTEEELQDAIVWMLIEEKIEVTLCRNMEEVVEFMTDMTGRLCKLPYMDDVSELDCFKILKKGGGKDSQDEAWYRMISQVQGISEAKASALVERYPTMNSLYEAYEKCEDEVDKVRLLEDSFGTKKLNTKLSSVMYRIMTGDDGLELL